MNPFHTSLGICLHPYRAASASALILALLIIVVSTCYGSQTDIDANSLQRLRRARELQREASMIYGQGRFTESIPLLQEAVQINRELLGEDHPTYAKSLDQLAQIYGRLGKLKQAEALFLEAAEIRKEVLGYDHPDYARTLDRLAGLYRGMGEHGKAETVYLEELETWKKAVGEKHPDYARTLDRLASVYLSLSEYDRAEALLLKATEIWRYAVGENHRDYARSLEGLAWIYRYTGEYDRGEALFLESVEIWRKLVGERNLEYVGALERLGGFYHFLGELAKAEAAYLKALEIVKEVVGEGSPAFTRSVGRLAGLHRDRGDFVKAEEMYLEALRINKEILGKSYVSDYVRFLDGLAQVYHGMGKFGKAEALYLEELDISKELYGDKHQEFVFCMEKLAWLYRDMGEPGKSEKLCLQALEIGKEASGRKSYAYVRSLGSLLGLYYIRGEYGKAWALYPKMEEIKKELYTEKGSAYFGSLMWLARLHHAMGEYRKAEPLYLEALEGNREVLGQKHPIYPQTVRSLASLYSDMGEYARAEPLYLEALEIQKQARGERTPAYVSFLFDLAVLYRHMGEYAKAESLFMRAIEIVKDVFGERHPVYASVFLNGLATLYRDMGKYDKAEPLYYEALEVTKKLHGEGHPTYIAGLGELGLLYGCWHKPQLAFKYQLANLAGIDSFFGGIGLWASEQKQKAYSRKVDFNYDLFYSLITAYGGRENKTLNRSFVAHLVYKGRIADTLARRSRIALSFKDPRGKEDMVNLKEVMREIANMYLRGPGELNAATYRQMLGELEQKKEEFEEVLARKSAEYGQDRTVTLTADIVAGALRDGDVYLDYINYRRFDYEAAKWTEQRTYLAFLVRRDAGGKAAVRIEDLGSAADIEKLVTDLRGALKGDTAGQRGVGGIRSESPEPGKVVSEIGAQLYRKIVAPFTEEIADATTLYISPGGCLNLIPFEILTVPEESAYLCDRKRIVYTFGRDICASNVAREKSSKDKSRSSICIVAAPNFEPGKGEDPRPESVVSAPNHRLPRGAVRNWPLILEPLPGTMVESKAIQHIADGGNIKTYLGDSAREETVKAFHHPHVLHFATHGFFLEDVERADPHMALRVTEAVFEPEQSAFVGETVLRGSVQAYDPLLRSGLALAGFNRLGRGVPIPSNQDDGILTAAEVAGMDLLGTELVVLSACDTGLGEVYRGEGVAGLRRAFRIAGAQHILMSLWDVPDEETVWLMEEFYIHYLAGNTPLAALNKARIAVRKRLIARDGIDHPYYWAAFILEGTSFE